LPAASIVAFQYDQAHHFRHTGMSKPFKLAVKAVILDEQQRCLLVRRSAFNHSFVDCWEWPGGKVDDGEAFADAVLRETREETSLEIEMTGLAGATKFEMPAVNVVLLCMEARVVSGELRLIEEHEEFAWVSILEVPQRNILETMKPALKNLLDKRKCHEYKSRFH
jgi:8-oxo-dGTP diphosphatase